MIDKRLFGYIGLFGDRDSVTRAMKEFNDVLNTIKNGEDKVALMTAALVLSNTLAKISCSLADLIEKNSLKDLRLVDGRAVNEITVAELYRDYDFPFEEENIKDLLAKLSVHSECPMNEVLAQLPGEVRIFLLMATPKGHKGAEAATA